MSTNSYIATEERERGTVDRHVYTSYLLANRRSWMWITLISILLIANTFAPSGFRWLIGAWVDNCQTLECQESLSHQVQSMMASVGNTSTFEFLVYFVLLGMIITGSCWFVERLHLNLGSMNLHRSMVNSFHRVRISFFDQNPSGRLIRRFSSDYSALLNEIPEHASSIATCLLSLAWAVLMAALEAPPVLIVCAPCAWFYFKLQNLYRPASRETQRLAKVLESPVWSLFSETIRGFQVVRAFNRSQVFESRLIKLFQSYGMAFFLRGRMTRWLTLRLKLVAECFSFACTLYSIYAVQSGLIGIGTAGFLMSLAIGLDSTMQWLTRAFAELETSMVSVERVLEYRNLEAEDHTQKQMITPAESFPEHGKIVFKNYSMSYRPDSDIVLSDLNIVIPAGSRVGIIGRTGAGKSSLFQSLFRMVTVQSGDILIDEQSIHTLSVHRLRRIFGIVPQEPHLFSGTVRSNLDRGSSLTDDDIWEALEVAGMHSFIQSMEKGLDTPVLDEGANFSVGQRQLLCMARAILSDAKIILMDEATANVDGETDRLIHDALNRSFKDQTILIIAHRLDTVQDCDYVLTMNQGECVGLTQPKELKIDPDSLI